MVASGRDSSDVFREGRVAQQLSRAQRRRAPVRRTRRTRRAQRGAGRGAGAGVALEVVEGGDAHAAQADAEPVKGESKPCGPGPNFLRLPPFLVLLKESDQNWGGGGGSPLKRQAQVFRNARACFVLISATLLRLKGNRRPQPSHW